MNNESLKALATCAAIIGSLIIVSAALQPSHDAVNDDPAANTSVVEQSAADVSLEHIGEANALPDEADDATRNRLLVSGQQWGSTTSPPNQSPPAPRPYQQPAALPSGRWERRRVKTGFRTYEDRLVWVSYQPQGRTFSSCAGGRCR